MEKIAELFEQTDKTIQVIADELGLSYKVVATFIKKNYSKEQRGERKSRCYRLSKLGNKNPMHGKFEEAHHNYKGRVADGNGYFMVLKPEWYTGREGSKHVFEHSVVMCEALGISEIPRGFVVHHIDHDKTNNGLNNLALLSNAAHNRLHQLERATTRAEARRGSVDPRSAVHPSPSGAGGDIVYSSQ